VNTDRNDIYKNHTRVQYPQYASLYSLRTTRFKYEENYDLHLINIGALDLYFQDNHLLWQMLVTQISRYQTCNVNMLEYIVCSCRTWSKYRLLTSPQTILSAHFKQISEEQVQNFVSETWLLRASWHKFLNSRSKISLQRPDFWGHPDTNFWTAGPKFRFRDLTSEGIPTQISEEQAQSFVSDTRLLRASRHKFLNSRSKISFQRPDFWGHPDRNFWREGPKFRFRDL